jgi:TRAP-type uncharacterized transport system fused permease subunit
MPTWSKEVREPDLQLEQETSADLYTRRESLHGSPVSIMPSLLVLLGRSLNLIAALVAIYSLFRYDNRIVQIRLGILNAFVLAILLGSALYLLSIQRQKETRLLMDWLLLAVAFISNLLANRYISKDEESIKSADRIR